MRDDDSVKGLAISIHAPHAGRDGLIVGHELPS